MKLCPLCDTTLATTSFGSNKNRRDGLAVYCKACRASAAKARYARQRAVTAAARGERAARFRTERRELSAKKDRARAAEWYRNNTERAKARVTARMASNPALMTEARHRRRAALRNAPGDGITSEQWRQMVTESLGLCAYCNERPARLTLDHIEPLSGGGAHDISNAAAACPNCNASKQDRSLVIWLALKQVAA